MKLKARNDDIGELYDVDMCFSVEVNDRKLKRM